MVDRPAALSAPRRLLLATDLSSRGDRALDRARQLAQVWDAELHIVHAIQTPAPTVPAGVDATKYLQGRHDPRKEAWRVLQRDLRPDEFGATVHLVEAGPPAAAILAVAEREGCDLVVLGETRQRILAPLGESTVEQVMRTSPVSVLAVRDRPHGPYRDLLVGTDFTDEARQALFDVAVLFPEASITLLHADAMPYAYLLAGTPDGRDWPARQLARLRDQVQATGLPAERQAAIRSAFESGPAAAMLRRHVLEKNNDLTVIGAHPRGILFDALIGNSRRIVDWIPGDILMVRAKR